MTIVSRMSAVTSCSVTRRLLFSAHGLTALVGQRPL
jgi:hypothetical protein